ncbi:MAG: LPS assembly lipoprotein LptE [Pseudohongiellaceae bacterium]
MNRFMNSFMNRLMSSSRSRVKSQSQSVCMTLILLTVLSGCGFSLRGGAELPESFSTIGLTLQQPGSEFSRLLQRSLRAADITVVTDSTAFTSDMPRLAIADESVSNRPVTVNPRARAAQYELQVAVAVSLATMDNVLLEPQTLSVQREYFEDIENIAGSQEEVDLLITEMRRELVNQLMRRLEAAVEQP